MLVVLMFMVAQLVIGTYRAYVSTMLAVVVW